MSRTANLILDFGILGEAEVHVEYDYDPGRPGRYSGPPEVCYPDEQEETDILIATVQFQPTSPVLDITDFLREDFSVHKALCKVEAAAREASS